MTSKLKINVVVRPKRQVTLPRDICNQLGVTTGDSLELEIDGNKLIAVPKKKIALEALHEIRETFERYGVSREELLEAGRKVRRELTKDRHAKKS